MAYMNTIEDNEELEIRSNKQGQAGPNGPKKDVEKTKQSNN